MTYTSLEETSASSVGQILKRARLGRGLTLDEVSKSLFISKRQLSFLEEDKEHLVCDVYTLGFVKLYAQYLELNEADIIEKFKAQAAPHAKDAHLTLPTPLPGRSMPSLPILLVSSLLLVGIIFGWKWLSIEKASTMMPVTYKGVSLHIQRNQS